MVLVSGNLSRGDPISICFYDPLLACPPASPRPPHSLLSMNCACDAGALSMHAVSGDGVVHAAGHRNLCNYLSVDEKKMHIKYWITVWCAEEMRYSQLRCNLEYLKLQPVHLLGATFTGPLSWVMRIIWGYNRNGTLCLNSDRSTSSSSCDNVTGHCQTPWVGFPAGPAQFMRSCSA